MTAEIVNKINEYKKLKNAVILVHNYQLPQIQDVADYVGDSLGLSIEASKTKADIIVFCGVHFMAETAAIICPDKKVIVPDVNAGCPMADMINAEGVKKLKAEHPGHIVVAYINTTAEVKAESDYCCTSANAVKVVEKLMDKNIIFIPDKYLGDYVSKQTGKKMVLFNGYCPIHMMILPEHVKGAKQEHPNAVVIVHPECLPEVKALADKVLSTGGMIKFTKESPSQEFIIGTETGIIYRLQKENPSKKFHPANPLAICRNMKKTTIDKLLRSLENEETRVTVPGKVASRAKLSIDRMLKLV
jgi:quinolinate synthase